MEEKELEIEEEMKEEGEEELAKEEEDKEEEQKEEEQKESKKKPGIPLCGQCGGGICHSFDSPKYQPDSGGGHAADSGSGRIFQGSDDSGVSGG